MTKDTRYAIRFPLEVQATLKRYAQEDSRSFNSEVVWILREYIKQREGGKDAKELQIPPLSKQDH